jgi:hypothetical protein
MLKVNNSSDVQNSTFSFNCNDLTNVDDSIIISEANGLLHNGLAVRCPYTYLFKYFDADTEDRIQLVGDIMGTEGVWEKFIPRVAWIPNYVHMIARELPLVEDMDKVALKIAYKNWQVPTTRSSDSSVVEQAMYQDGIPFVPFNCAEKQFTSQFGVATLSGLSVNCDQIHQNAVTVSNDSFLSTMVKVHKGALSVTPETYSYDDVYADINDCNSPLVSELQSFSSYDYALLEERGRMNLQSYSVDKPMGFVPGAFSSSVNIRHLLCSRAISTMFSSVLTLFGGAKSEGVIVDPFFLDSDDEAGIKYGRTVLLRGPGTNFGDFNCNYTLLKALDSDSYTRAVDDKARAVADFRVQSASLSLAPNVLHESVVKFSEDWDNTKLIEYCESLRLIPDECSYGDDLAETIGVPEIGALLVFHSCSNSNPLDLGSYPMRCHLMRINEVVQDLGAGGATKDFFAYLVDVSSGLCMLIPKSLFPSDPTFNDSTDYAVFVDLRMVGALAKGCHVVNLLSSRVFLSNLSDSGMGFMSYIDFFAALEDLVREIYDDKNLVKKLAAYVIGKSSSDASKGFVLILQRLASMSAAFSDVFFLGASRTKLGEAEYKGILSSNLVLNTIGAFAKYDDNSESDDFTDFFVSNRSMRLGHNFNDDSSDESTTGAGHDESRGDSDDDDASRGDENQLVGLFS